MKALPEYALERFYDAPRETIWRMWTEAELFSSWYGPNVETRVHTMDVREGGTAHIEMQWADASQYQKFDYKVVQPPEKLVWIMSTADENWNSVRFPAMENWPQYLLSTVTINPEAGKQCMRFTWVPFGDVREEEVACFKAARQDVDAGWAAGLDLFEKLIVTL